MLNKAIKRQPVVRGQVIPPTKADLVIRFIHKFCRVPEGDKRGQPLVLLPFQEKFIRAVYDENRRVRRAYLSIARKNGKSALIACLVLVHLVGPLAIANSQIICAARSREQASIIFKLAMKMIRMSPQLTKLIRIVHSQKTLTGVSMNTEFRAISAEAGTAHGLSPVVAILDEVGQVKGPRDDLVEAIETAQGAYEQNSLLIAISTQASTDNDLFSQWIDDAESSKDPSIVSHVYSAEPNCDIEDEDEWNKANPALGIFRSYEDVRSFCEQALRLPSKETSFRWLYLNQRIDATSPYISRSVWKACGYPPVAFGDLPVFAGLDLSEVRDLTAFVAIAPLDGVWQVHPTFWLPKVGLKEKARADRVQWDVWEKQGFLKTTPGKTIEYSFVAQFLKDFKDKYNLKKVGFDRYQFNHLKQWLLNVGFTEEEVEGDDAIFVPFGQGYKSMSPAIRDLEEDIGEGRIAHGMHPVLTVCMANAVVQMDHAMNKKFNKMKAKGRIDGAVALAMARSVAATHEPTAVLDVKAMLG